MSARQLSLAANLSPSYVGKVETGTIDPSFKTFSKIAMALQMTSCEVMLLVEAEGQ